MSEQKESGDELSAREIELDAQWRRMPAIMKGGMDRASFELGWRLAWSECEKQGLTPDTAASTPAGFQEKK